MATKSENARLAVLETQMETVVKDVSEIKGDVKLLLGARHEVIGARAWIRSMAPWVAILISIAAVFVRSTGG